MVDIRVLWRMQGAPVVIIPGQQVETMTIQDDLNVWPLTHGALCGSEFPGERAPKPQILQTDLTSILWADHGRLPSLSINATQPTWCWVPAVPEVSRFLTFNL